MLVIQVLCYKTTPSSAKQFRSQVAWTQFRPAGGMRNIHIFSGDKTTPPVVLWTSHDVYGETNPQSVAIPWGNMKSPVYNNVLQSLRSAEQLEQTVSGWGQGTQSTEAVLLQLLVGRMLRTRAIHLKPLVYTPETGRAGQRGSLSLVVEGSWKMSWITFSSTNHSKK